MEPSTTLRHGAIRPPLRLAGRPGDPRDRVEQLVHRLREQEAARATSGGEERDDAWFDALRSAEERAQRLAHEVEQARGELGGVRVALVAAPVGGDVPALARPFLPRLDLDLALRGSVLALLAGLLALIVWAGVSDYALRVTSDTPTFIALVTGMAERPFQEQSPFLANQVATQHATPYIQAVAFLWSFLGGGERDPVTAGRLLALIGIPVFALLLYSVFLYARRLAGSRAAWLSLPVLLGIFGPPHVIWASDQSLHGALYASYFPQNLAIAMLLLTLLALERNSYPSLALACLGAATTMLVHPFSGVLLCLLATFQGCYMALRGKPGYYRAPVALTVGFALGLTWPAYSLDRAFAETGMRGVFFVALCAVSVFAVHGLARIKRPTQAPRALTRLTRTTIDGQCRAQARRRRRRRHRDRRRLGDGARPLAAGGVGAPRDLLGGRPLALAASPHRGDGRHIGARTARAQRARRSGRVVRRLPRTRIARCRRPPDSRLVPVPPLVPDPTRDRRRGRARQRRENADARARARDVLARHWRQGGDAPRGSADA